MAEKNTQVAAAESNTQVATKITSPLSEWTNGVTNMVTEDFNICGVQFDEYSKQCAMAAMTRIYQLVMDENYDVKKLKASNLRQVVGCAASLKLNANAVPRECYFQLRSKKVGKDSWEKVVEMGIEGDGNDAILRSFGVDIDRVYPYWRVCEGGTNLRTRSTAELKSRRQNGSHAECLIKS